jgi:hypothetical protein
VARECWICLVQVGVLFLCDEHGLVIKDFARLLKVLKTLVLRASGRRIRVTGAIVRHTQVPRVKERIHSLSDNPGIVFAIHTDMHSMVTRAEPVRGRRPQAGPPVSVLRHREYGDAESVPGRRPRPPVMEVPNKALSLALSPPSVRRSAFGGDSPSQSG